MNKKEIALGLLILILSACESFSLRNDKTIENQTTDPNSYNPKYTFHTDWFSTSRPAWIENILFLKGKENLKYLEIGVFEGRSFLWVLDNILTHETSEAYAVDSWNHPVDKPSEVMRTFLNNLEISGHKKKVHVIPESSQTALPKLNKVSFDLIYIDGDHSAASVLEDIVLSWLLLKEDGILIFDDYLFKKDKWPIQKRPQIAIESFLNIYKGEYSLIHKGYQVMIQKLNSKTLGSCLPRYCSQDNQYKYFWHADRLTNLNGEIVTLPQSQRDRVILKLKKE